MFFPGQIVNIVMIITMVYILLVIRWSVGVEWDIIVREVLYQAEAKGFVSIRRLHAAIDPRWHFDQFSSLAKMHHFNETNKQTARESIPRNHIIA